MARHEPDFPEFDEEGATAIEGMAESTDLTHRRLRFNLIGLGLLALAVGLLFYFAIHATKERTELNHRLATLAGEQAMQAKQLARTAAARSTRVVRYLQGKEGLPGTPGPSGAAGGVGIPGLPGLSGPRGLFGPQGIGGIAGAGGLTGATGGIGATGGMGAQGSSGAAGSPGAQGDPGTQGPQGPPVGSFTFTFTGVTYFCDDPDGDLAYTCTPV